MPAPVDNRPVLSLILGIMSLTVALASCGCGGCLIAWMPLGMGAGGWYLSGQVEGDMRDGIAEGVDPSLVSAAKITSIIGTVISGLVMLGYAAIYLMYGGIFTLAMVLEAMK